MGYLRGLQRRLERKSKAPGPVEGLNIRTSFLRETPSQVGLSITGLKLFVIIGIALLITFTWLVLTIPKYDYIVEKRLGDNYRAVFSKDPPDRPPGPSAHEGLYRPEVTDMDQDAATVYLATRGHGIQALSKGNSLWKTYDAITSRGELQNDIMQVKYRNEETGRRVWTLGCDGSVTLGKIHTFGIDFQRLFASGFWRYITMDDITAALMVGESHVVFGTSGKGAGAYNTVSHTWADFKELQDLKIKNIFHHEDTLWFLTDRGVFVHKAQQSQNSDVKFAHLLSHRLDQVDLSDLRVFGPDQAIALTRDHGLYFYKNGWSEKLLGGEAVAGLSQEAIRFSFSWENLIVVIGEKFGVAAYDPDKRNWRILLNGPLAALHGCDHDEHTVALASEDGLYFIRKSGVDHLLAGDTVLKASLWDGGCLYLLRGDGAKERAGWISPSGTRTILFSNTSLNLQTQPVITTVAFHEGQFWIGTQNSGIIRYTVQGRVIEQANESDKGQIRQVKRLEVIADKLFLLADGLLYRRDEQKWVLLREGVSDFKVEPKSEVLWVKTSAGELLWSGKSGEEPWFSGKGPEKLQTDAALAVFSPLGEDPKILFADLSTRKLHAYHLKRALWDKPLDIPGTHNFTSFSPAQDALYSVGPGGALYRNEQVLLGGSKPEFPLNNTLWVQQPGGPDSPVAVYGPGARVDYDPKTGQWKSKGHYHFLQNNEEVANLFPILPDVGGKLVRTSTDRLLIVDTDWENGVLVNGGSGEHFDGESLWNLTGDGSVTGQHIEKNQDRSFNIQQSEFFSGAAPNLSHVLESWYAAPNLYFVTTQTFSVYDTNTNSWSNKSLPQDTLKAEVNGSALQLVSRDKIHNLAWPSLTGKSIPLPQGDFKNLNSDGKETIVTVGDGTSRRVFYLANKSWTQMPGNRAGFKGDLGAVTHLFVNDNSLWVYDRDGTAGRYAAGNWESFRTPGSFEMKAFWRGPNNGLFLVGKRSRSDRTDFPACYLTENSFSMLYPLPSAVAEFRVEQERFLWLRDPAGELFVYDLANPQTAGLSISKAVFSAQNGTKFTYFYDFVNGVYARTAVSPEDSGFKARIAAAEITEYYLERSANKDEIERIYLQTRRGMYVFEKRAQGWWLVSEYLSIGKLQIDDAMERIASPGEQVEPGTLPPEKAHFSVSVSEEGSYPFMKALHGKIKPGRYADQAQEEMPGKPVSTEVSVGGIKAVLTASGPKYYVSAQAGSTIEITHAAGQFETDSPILDAAPTSNGQWAVLREKSFALYADRGLSKVVEFSKSLRPFSQSAFLEIVGSDLVLHDEDGLYTLSTQKNEVRPFKYTAKNFIYSDDVTALKVERNGRTISANVNGQPFWGQRKLPADEIRKIGTEKSKLYLLGGQGLWSFSTMGGKLSQRVRIDLPHRGAAQPSFKSCTDGTLRLESDRKLFAISSQRKEVGIDDCAASKVEAKENAWKWLSGPDSKGLVFETEVEGKPQRVDRQACDGCGFRDDVFTWVAAHGGKVYAANGLGVTTVSAGGKEKVFLSGKQVEELKDFDGTLFSHSGDNLYRLSTTGAWEPYSKYSSSRIFDQFTPVYSDCLLKLESKHGAVRIRTSEDQPVYWDSSLRKFKTDIIADFAPFGEELFAINSQDGRVISFDSGGSRTGCYIGAAHVKKLDVYGSNLYAIGPGEVRALKRTGAETRFDETTPIVDLPSFGGLAFQINLLSGNNEASILPAAGGRVLERYWSEGRFSFDTVHSLEGGDLSWWVSSAAGLIALRDRETAPIEKMFTSPTNMEGMAQKDGRLHVLAGREEKLLDEKSERFIAPEKSAFTRTVFDFASTGKEGGYSWRASEVAQTDPRPTFLLKTQSHSDPEVFREGIFVWDYVLQGARDDRSERYWLISPGHISVNAVEASEGAGTRLTVFDFPEMPLDTPPGYSMADAVFRDGVLFALFTNDKGEELVRKRFQQGWAPTTASEYPFWYPAVEFNLKENIWKAYQITHTHFYSRLGIFNFIGPKDYPLFTPLEWASDYGKFSFDYLTSIHPEGNTVWAGSKGGLLKFRLEAKDHPRLDLEQIFLPEEGLAHYCVRKLAQYGGNENLQLLESDRNGVEAVQELSLPHWSKGNSADFKLSKQEFPISKDAKYVFKYDQVRDTGQLWIEVGSANRVLLLNCAGRPAPRKSVRIRWPGMYFVQFGQADFEFEPPASGQGEAFSRVFNASDPPGICDIKPVITDSAGIIWGEIRGTPALGLPSGEVYAITGLPEIEGIRVEDRNLTWILSGKEGGKEYQLAMDRGTVEELKENTGETIEWVEYVPPPGTGIFHYLQKSGLLAERGVFARMLGSEPIDLEKWVKIIAEKNKIPWGGRSNVDYQLQRDVKYLMPRKIASVRKIDKRLEFPLIVGSRTYKHFGREDKGHPNLSENKLGLWAFSGMDFLRLDTQRMRAFFERFPTKLQPRKIWTDGEKILLSFVQEDQAEVWQFVPQQIQKSEVNAADLNRVLWSKSTRRLEAASGDGLIVDNGLSSQTVMHSSEWFFGTKFGKVVKILEDSEGNGYWFATRTSGLVWSRDPF
ncbi:hypothetical protein SBDP2_330005 [Syntrophobacter sp. SbD2]|nr:hypothetical protein SBDP2_330005 [Syntrophobacter sp. SbD2]